MVVTSWTEDMPGGGPLDEQVGGYFGRDLKQFTGPASQ